MIDATHSPALRSWVVSADGHADFPIQNLPLGIFSVDGGAPRPGVAIGDEILDLARAFGDDLPAELREAASLNRFLAAGSGARAALRARVSGLLSSGHRVLPELLARAADCEMHLPARIGGYTDFYAGINHARTVGALFRPDNPLLPNYKYVPIGYHGRASSVRLSGVAVRRPNGQRLEPGDTVPRFGPASRLDFELELGIWIGPGNELGEPIPIDRAAEHIAGFCLLNDWSARDLQAWEYQPLGPFLAKNFATTISPWIITPEAMAPFRARQPARPEGDPAPLPYLWDDRDQAEGAIDLTLHVALSTARMRAEGLPPHPLSHGNALDLYWTAAQLVAHHASNGCNLEAGDLLGTGTISGPSAGQMGSLLEIIAGGKQPIELANGEIRRFLQDGDEIIMAARAIREGAVPIGFGTCRAVILPAA